MKNKDYPFYEIEQISNLKELVNLCANEYSDNHAFTFERENVTISISYRQFKLDTEALGAVLYSLNNQNVKIAVIGENSYEWIVSYYGVVNSGNIIVPLDRELPAADIKNILNDSSTEVLIYSDYFADVAKYLKNNGATVRSYINMNTLSALIETGKSLIQAGDNRIVDYIVNNHAMAALLYTSGTTGVAKGVMLSHHGIARVVVGACQSVKVRGNNLLVLPLHHSFGFVGSLSFMMLSGSEIVINSSLKNLLTDMEKFKPHNIFLVPLFVETFYKKIWDKAKEQRKDGLLKALIKISNALLKIGIDIRRKFFKSVLTAFGGNLELIVSGGAPIDDKYVQGLRNFGITTLNGYGITECSPVVSVNRNDYYRDGSVGQVLPICEVKILAADASGHGEICVKGDNVMLGYYKNEQATKEAFEEGWFKTGDIGYLDKDGFLFISGRKKNLIVLSNGKNVYPEELEFTLLNNITYIKEAVVYAKSNVIVAEVFLDTEKSPDGKSTIDSDVIKLNQTLPPYMSIGETVIRDTEFPKTTTKKIKRIYSDESLYIEKDMPSKADDNGIYTLEMFGSSVAEIVLSIVSNHAEDKPVTTDSRFKYDLGLDSLKMIEISIEVESIFNIIVADNMGAIRTVQDLVAMVENGGAKKRDVEYNIEDYPIPKTAKDIRRLKRYMQLSRLAWRFKVVGLDNIPSNGHYIICPNHQSYFDSLWIWAAIGYKRVDLQRISCLAAEVFLSKKSLLSMIGGIPVERMGNTIPAIKRGLNCIQNGYTMMIFPEGTRSRDGKIHKFKGGAAKLAIEAEVPIIPVHIDGAWDIFPPHKKRPKIFRFGRRYPINITFGQAIMPDTKSIEELTMKIQTAVEQL